VNEAVAFKLVDKTHPDKWFIFDDQHLLPAVHRQGSPTAVRRLNAGLMGTILPSKKVFLQWSRIA
jgi:hypothetical protein